MLTEQYKRMFPGQRSTQLILHRTTSFVHYYCIRFCGETNDSVLNSLILLALLPEATSPQTDITPNTVGIPPRSYRTTDSDYQKS